MPSVHKRLAPGGPWVRIAYRAADYTAPEKELEEMRQHDYSANEALGIYDGMFQNFDRVREFERDGARWVVLAERSRRWLIEVRLTDERPLDIRPLPPEQAWLHGRTQDLAVTPPIAFEGEPPPGVTGQEALKPGSQASGR